MDNRLLKDNHAFISFLLDVKLMIVFINETEDHISTVINRLFHDLSYDYKDLIAGIGANQSTIFNIKNSYTQAIKVLDLIKKSVIKKPIFLYNELNFLKLLLPMNDLDALRDYKNEKLYQLEKYDELNNTKYLQTLECYLNNNCSINQTAKELFVHRNTINYQISRIAQILDKNLASFKTRCDLYLAIQIKYYLEVC
ncbi:hypothetical protein GMB86_07210 [Terrilactibacillus sp. BCM23-1]|uniref:PucR C-terminal helix-turn-helix domain-containing protein n=1 Tax=Terrilactibacillus tamarindi TaxID=2599694 RepID=A0A6N8CRH8_9BACI|nr:hypothetical protein [Terrilactibacillus tamarindi]